MYTPFLLSIPSHIMKTLVSFPYLAIHQNLLAEKSHAGLLAVFYIRLIKSYFLTDILSCTIQYKVIIV